MSKSAINTWRGNVEDEAGQAKEISNYIKMLRHPVFMSGDIIYKGAPGVMYLEEVFGNYEKMMSEYKRPTRDEVIQYMAVYMSHARLGNTYVLSEERLSDENLANVAESMYSYFKEMKHE